MTADKEGDWQLHLRSCSSMLPYYAFGNKVNYTRCTPTYILEMLRLSKPAKDAFGKGELSVKITKGSFNATYTDMATEHHVKEVKGPGGLKNVIRIRDTTYHR